jgi:hypothetical protein
MNTISEGKGFLGSQQLGVMGGEVWEYCGRYRSQGCRCFCVS